MPANAAFNFKSYLVWFTLTLVIGIAVLLVFVVAVDPYAIYDAPRRANFNVVKPSLTRYQKEIKQVRAQRAAPRFVILGNSRAEIGFDPASAAFGDLAGHGFNLAIAGSGLSTSVQQLDELVASGVRPQTIIIGVEFLDFLETERAVTAASSNVPAMPVPGRGKNNWWRFDALFSLESIKDAARTLRIQHSAEAATLSSLGFNPLNEYRAYVRDDGYHSIFAQRAGESASNIRHKSPNLLSAADLQSLRHLLRTATNIDADVKMIIYPYHAQIMNMFEEAGMGAVFRMWKHRLLEEVALIEKEKPHSKLALYDFSGYGEFTCEHIPLASEKGQVETKWYWEGGHFKRQLGDKVIDRIFSAPIASDRNFGFLLTSESEAANNARIAKQREMCEASQPANFKSYLRGYALGN